MSDQNTALDNPDQEPKAPEDSIEAAAAALSGLMDESGAITELDSETAAENQATDEPKAQAKTEAVEPAEPDFVEVDIDGYKVSLPKDKADKLAAERLMQADYTRKTMQTAEARKAAEAEQAKTIQERQSAKQQLAAITTTLEAAVQSGQLKAPDPGLLDSDPVSYLKQQAQWSQAQQAYAQAKQQMGLIQQQEQHHEQFQRQQILETERTQLLAKVPEWKDEGKAQAEKAEFMPWLLKQGYTPEQIENTLDHRAIVAQLQAFRYQKLIADQKAVIAKKVPPPSARPVKPGTAQEGAQTQINKSAMQRLYRNGKVDDAASAIASLLS